MPSGVIHGPYARQETEFKLKFWFAFAVDGEKNARRYEVSIGKGDKAMKARRRPFYPGKVPKQAGNFNAYPIPEDLHALPYTHYPRHERDRFVDAAQSLLPGEDVADVVRVRLRLPPANMHKGDEDVPDC